MSHPRAFTLIELLVVISIIALLMAVLLPTLARARKHAQAAACQVTLRQWGTTLALYAEDHQGRFPRTPYSAVWMLTARAVTMRARLADYREGEPNNAMQYHLVRTEGMLCPAATKPADGSAGFGAVYTVRGVSWKFYVAYGATYKAWMLTEPGPPLSVSYGLNDWLFDAPPDPVPFAPPPPAYTNIYSLRRTAGMPLLVDAMYPSASPDAHVTPPPEEDWPRRGRNMAPFCINRHNGHVNCLFLDWSVRKVGLKELWTLKWHKDFDPAGKWTQAGGVKPEDWPQWMRKFKDY